MAKFEHALQLLLQHEGGYVNDPDDQGGETYKGIARICKRIYLVEREIYLTTIPPVNNIN